MEYARRPNDGYCPWCKKDVQVVKKTSSWRKRWCGNAWETICLPLNCVLTTLCYPDTFTPGYDWNCSECHQRLAFKGAKSKGKESFIPVGEGTLKVGCPPHRNPLYTRWENDTQMRVSLAKQSTDLLAGMILKMIRVPLEKHGLNGVGFIEEDNREDHNERVMRSIIDAIWRTHFGKMPQGLKSEEIEARITNAHLIAKNGPYVPRFAKGLSGGWTETKNPWIGYLAAFLIEEFGLSAEMMEHFNRLRDERNRELAGKSEFERLNESMTFAVMEVMGIDLD